MSTSSPIFELSDGEQSLAFWPIERSVSPREGDLRLQVRAATRGFTGESQVWLEMEVGRQFVRQLDEVERERRGSATLTSMSPGALVLTVKIVDAAGHAAVAGCVVHRSRTRRGLIEASLGFDIDLDPDRIPELLDVARGLFAEGEGAK